MIGPALSDSPARFKPCSMCSAGTAKGQLGGAKGLKAFRAKGELPQERLHPAIAERCHAQYLRSEFHSAVLRLTRRWKCRSVPQPTAAIRDRNDACVKGIDPEAGR
jgi:hypothetical protein